MTHDDSNDQVSNRDDDEWTSADTVDLQKSSDTATTAISVPAATVATPSVDATRQPGRVAKSAPSRFSRLSRKRWITIAVVGALVVGLLGLGGTELYLRNQVTTCLSRAFGSLTGAPTDVSMSGRPVLWQALTKEIPFVEVNSTAKDGGSGRMHLRVDRITSGGDKSTIGSIKGEGVVPFDQVLATAGNSPVTTDPNAPAQPGRIESIKSNGDGTFDVTSTVTAVIIPLPVTVTLRPEVKDGKAHLEVVRANMLVFGIPPDYAQTIVDEMTSAMFGSMLKDLTLTKFEVQGEGIAFAVNGSNVTVNENLIRPRNDCADVTAMR